MDDKLNITGAASGLLLSHIKRANGISGLDITRRRFLLGSSFIFLHPVALLSSAHAGMESDNPHLRVFRNQEGFELSYRGRQWRFLTKPFMNNANSTFNLLPGERTIVESTTIKLGNWSFSGFAKRSDFEATIYRKRGRWEIRLSFYPFKTDYTEMGLDDWMAGKYSDNYSPNSQTYKVGAASGISVEGTTRSLKWNKDLSLVFQDHESNIFYRDAGGAPGKPIGKGRYGFAASTMEAIAGLQPSELLQKLEPEYQINSTTVISFSGVELLHLGRTNDGQSLTLELRQSDRYEGNNGSPVTIETYQKSRKRKGILTVKGTGTLLVETPGESTVTRLHLEEFCLVSQIGLMSKEIDFAAKLSRKTFRLNDLSSTSMDITDSSEMPLGSGFGINAGQVSLRITGSGDLIHQSITNGQAGALVFPARLIRAHVPVSGASRADLLFKDTNVDIVIGYRKVGGARTAKLGSSTKAIDAADQLIDNSDRDGACMGVLSITRTPFFQVPLENATLRLARSTDLFDLQFGFQNYSLTVSNGVSHLIPRWGFPKCSSEFGRPRRVAIFSPQHVQEEVFHYQRGSGDADPESLSGEPLEVFSETSELASGPSTIRVPKHLRNSALARTRVAGATRLVFEEVDEKASESRPTEITVETITDWTDLALVVHNRALPRNVTLEEQLGLVGITPSTSRDAARIKISESLTPPQEWETSLEPVTGLIFSPDPSALFVTPRKPPVPGDASIWTSHLHLKPNSAVRAIYARGLDKGYLNNIESKDLDNLPYVSSLNAKDRREIVGTTSVYGVAALRRLQVEGNDESGMAYDDPKGMVIRPETAFKYLSIEKIPYGTQGKKAFQEGIIIPKPFVDFDLAMTSVGSNLSLRWEGEPPAPLANDEFFKDAFRIESYIHRTKYARDALVQVTYKGFLFPLGHRAAYIKLSERTMLPFGDNKEKLMPTAYLTMRRFIVVRKPKKTFPALNQPNSSREFPAKDIELLTTITPDLAPPEPIEANLKAMPEGDRDTDATPRPIRDAHVFWPRTGKAAGTEVNFEFRINGDETPASSKLIFVDNKAAHTPALIKKLVEEYSKGEESEIFKTTPRFRTVTHSGVDRKYAETERAGETSFRTHSWTLGVEGRASLVPANEGNSEGGKADYIVEETYEMDAFMEGKDQPPFYPRVKSARIHMQSVDRMLGRPQGPIKVKFNHDLYVRQAFDIQRNPSEIYLEVISPVIKLDFTQQGQSSGGVAKPNSYLAAISRKVGFVGGQPQKAPALMPTSMADELVAGRSEQTLLLKSSLRQVESAALSATKSGSFSLNFDGAKAGQFDPSEFLPDGKILGILEIRDLVKAAAIIAAPQLKEVYQFAAHSIEELLDILVDLGPTLSKKINAVITQADATLRTTLPVSIDLNTTDLYPELVNQLRGFAAISSQVGKEAAELKKRQAILRQAGTPAEEIAEKIAKQFAPYLTELYGAGKSLIETIDDVVDNPTPAIVGETIAEFQRYRQEVTKAIDNFKPKDILSSLKDVAFESFCESLIKTDTFELLFGPAAYEDRRHRVVQFPAPPANASMSPDDDKALLMRACQEVLQHPEQIAPYLQRSLFYQVYGRATSQLLLEIKRVEVGGDALIQWSRRKLGETLVGFLKFGEHYVSAEVVSQAAWQIVNIVEQELVAPIDITNPMDDLTRRLAVVVSKSEPILKKYKAQLNEALSDGSKRLVKQSKLIEDEVANVVAAQTFEAKEAIEKKIRSLESEFGVLKRQNQALADLISEIERDNAQNLAKRVGTELARELRAPLEAYKAEVQAKVKQFGRDLLSRSLGTTSLLLEQLRDTVLLERISSTYETARDTLCFHPGDRADGGQSAFSLAISLINFVPAEELATKLIEVQNAVDTLPAPVSMPEELRSKFTLELSTAKRSFNVLIDEVQNFARVQIHLKSLGLVDDESENVNICANPKKYLEPIEQAYNLRRSAIDALSDVFSDFHQLQRTLEDSDLSISIKKKLRSEVAPELVKVLKILSAVEVFAQTDLKILLAKLLSKIGNSESKVRKLVEDDFTGFKLEAEKIDKEIRALKGTLDTSTALMAQRVSAYVATQEKKVVARILQGLIPVSDAVLEVSKSTAGSVAKFCELLITGIYSPAGLVLNELKKLVEKEETDKYSSALLALLAEPAIAKLTNAEEAVKAEESKLQELATAAQNFSNSSTSLTADTLLERIKALTSQSPGGAPEFAVVQAVNVVADLAEALARGQLDKVFDFDGVRDQITAAIADLIPSRVSQSYDWDTELGPFPSSSPIFEIDRALLSGASNDKDIVIPKTADGKFNDLVLKTRIEVDLLSGARSVTAVGEMRPYKINLLGGVIDLVTIGFKGMRVVSQNGSKPKITSKIADVEIGQALTFLEALGPFFGPKPDNGPYVRLNLSPFGVLAGYRFSAPVIPVGAMLFSGISIMAEVMLPFENQQATFAFAFASKRNPFLVSMPPYGGGGFVGLLASPKGVIGFEIQIEFGAVVPIEYGPLKAEGRVTAGIYLMSRPGLRVLEGFVRAIGEGNIACFSISVCLEVTIRQANGGSMAGSATFSFTFKLAFAEVDYSVGVSHEVEGGGGSSNNAGGQLSNAALSARLLGTGKYKCDAVIRSILPDRRTQWADYKKGFDI